MNPESVDRYARHLVLKEIGGAGQNTLLSSKIVIVGAGGLGGPVALYLAAAGIGHITLIDDDIIERSNLQRQIQFSESDIGQSKAEVTASKIMKQNPDVSAIAVIERLTSKTAERLLSGHDLILDGVDNFQTRFDINEASLTLKIPLISGALGRWEGQVCAFSGTGNDPCYRCLVPDIPPQAETCSEVGVIGALAGIIGSIMALEAIKILIKSDTSLQNKLWIYDGLDAKGRRLTLPKDPKCPACNKA